MTVTHNIQSRSEHLTLGLSGDNSENEIVVSQSTQFLQEDKVMPQDSKFKKALVAAATSALVVTGMPAQAQMVMTNLGTNPVIAGMPVVCNGAVSYVAQIPDIAMARPGALFFRPDFFNLPTYVQLYIYAHECAHQFVGGNEVAADCWAVRTGRDQGWLPRQGLEQVCQYTYHSRGDWTHPAGPVRCQNMRMCYAS
jgi:hypothetical protein